MTGIRLAFTVAVAKRSNSRNSASTSLDVHRYDFGPELLHELASALFVPGIGVGMQEADRDRFDLLRLQPLDGARDLFLRKRRHFRAVVRDAARDFDAAIARRGRHRLRDVEVEVMRPALARELEHVAKARGRDHAGARPLAFEHRVGRERRAEHEELHVVAPRGRSTRAARRCRRGCRAPDRR